MPKAASRFHALDSIVHSESQARCPSTWSLLLALCAGPLSRFEERPWSISASAEESLVCEHGPGLPNSARPRGSNSSSAAVTDPEWRSEGELFHSMIAPCSKSQTLHQARPAGTSCCRGLTGMISRTGMMADSPAILAQAFMAADLSLQLVRFLNCCFGPTCRI